MDHDWSAMDPDGVLANAVTAPALPHVLILTPVKDVARWLPGYFSLLANLTYPAKLISLGMLESDSQDRSWQVASAHIERANSHFRRAHVWKKDFGYRIPHGKARYADAIQAERRSILARSRNHLLFHA
ncbi:MAG: hypothetical protein IT335_05100, partial [Thermomicrobiales bacterium]|nr:hypothetical protein [Thermomicrobiales bacterium]